MKTTRPITRRFVSDKGGNFSFVLAAAAIAILGAGGVAVDFANAVRSKSATMNAADAAVLAATRAIVEKGMTQKAAEALARNQFDADMLNQGVDLAVNQFELKPDGIGGYSLIVQGEIPTTLARSMGYSNIPISVSPSASMGMGAVEIAISFDVTSSMGFGTTWEDAIDVVNNALTALKTNSSDFSVMFIPFTDRVNIGAGRVGLLPNGVLTGSGDKDNGHGNDEDKCDESNPGKGKKAVCALGDLAGLDVSPESLVPNWSGCAEPRTTNKVGRSVYYADALAPNLLARFEPFLNGTLALSHPDYELACNDQEIVGPTKNVDDVIEVLGGLKKGGTGRFDEGLVWAWRALSPNWKGYWKDGAPADSGVDLANYPKPAGTTKKVAVLVTDGNTTGYYQEYNKQMVFGYNNGTKEEFETLVTMCEDMAAEGISPHVLHVNGNTAAEPYFKQCASNGGAYYKVGNKSELIAAFAAISATSSGLRLTN